MRLIDCQTLKLVDFDNEDALPPYAILSHTWGQDDRQVHNEIFFGDDGLGPSLSFDDLTESKHDRTSLHDLTETKEGSLAANVLSLQVHPWRSRYQMVANRRTYKKLHSVCARASQDGLNFAWIDVCCFDRSNLTEISATINSMFRWYKHAKVCYAYLEDVDENEDFGRASWFTRGWTLPELIAPQEVLLFNTKWRLIGPRTSLAKQISEITHIDSTLLSRDPGEDVSVALERFDVDTRMSWAKSRKTTYVEDKAYCLLGIFNVHMLLIYGEGENALRRLQEQIAQQHPDTRLLNGNSDKLALPNTLAHEDSHQAYITYNGREPTHRQELSSPRLMVSSYLTHLEEQLFDAEVRTTNLQQFVPAGDLDRIIQEQSVLRCVQEVFPDLPLEGHILQARAICSLDRPFRQIFGILVLSDMVDEISTFLDLDLHDGHLPMPDDLHREAPYDSNMTNEKATDPKWLTFFKRCSRRSRLSVFSLFQWRILVPIFTNVDGVRHRNFSPKIVLPFIRAEETEDSTDNQIRYGAFSQIRKTWIHPQHDDFRDPVLQVNQLRTSKLPTHTGQEPHTSNRSYAIKSLHSHSKRAFNREVEILKRFSGKPHIVQLLCTFETQRTFVGDSSSTYHMMFPWAEGDLSFFWKGNDILHGNAALLEWMAKQCYGLALGLASIHGTGRANGTSEEEPTYGRHGDITAHNILWFTSNDTGASNPGDLLIGDFGLADFHRQRSRSDLTSQSIARSGTYRGPEFDTSETISRKADIWMLGCVYLEFVTWFIRGYQAVHVDFPQARTSKDIYGIGSDSFFKVAKDSDGHRTAILKPQVRAWIKALKTQVKAPFLEDFLDVIEKSMLCVEVASRIDSAELSEKLEKMHYKVLHEAGYRVCRLVAKSTEIEAVKSTNSRQSRSRERRSWIKRFLSQRSISSS